jgi:hypothetical protein
MDAATALERESLVVAPQGHLRSLRLLQFQVHHPDDASRASVEQYVRARFAQMHAAQVDHFLPRLVSLGSAGALCSAVGLAPATAGRLFAECYLDEPIERLISAATGEVVGRERILEIGNLVSTWKGGSLLLFVFLSELIDRLGYRFVLFTATREVERLLAKLGYAPVTLAFADPARLPDGGRGWGTYYERSPRVMFGDVPPAVALARQDRLYRVVARMIAAQVERASEAFWRSDAPREA